MVFEWDELDRIEDAEMFLQGATVRDLGYEVMSLQLFYDVREIGYAQECIRNGKMPYSE